MQNSEIEELMKSTLKSSMPPRRLTSWVATGVPKAPTAFAIETDGKVETISVAGCARQALETLAQGPIFSAASCSLAHAVKCLRDAGIVIETHRFPGAEPGATFGVYELKSAVRRAS